MSDYGWLDGMKVGSGVARALVLYIINEGGEPSRNLDLAQLADGTEFSVSEIRQAVQHLVDHGFARVEDGTLCLLTPTVLAMEAEAAERIAEAERRRDEKIAARGGLVNRKAIPASVRQFVFDRDGHACLRCGATDSLTLDHVFPWSLGGPDTVDNLQTLCGRCNSSKGDRT